MDIKVLSALSDNYMYLIIDKASKLAAIVDPVEPKKVMAAVKAEGVQLTTVLTTHHHYDHAGGNKELAKLVPSLEVLGGDERVDALTRNVTQGDTLTVGKLNVKCLFTPCHTKGHICYVVEGEGDDPAVFTGDTLFIAGCGRFFEGNADEMYNALIENLGSLPEKTRVFCGYEYTVKNLQFALTVEPDNPDIKSKIEWAEGQRNQKLPTVPSTIGDEKKINPFVRVNEPDVQKHCNTSDGVSTMAILRKQKDSF